MSYRINWAMVINTKDIHKVMDILMKSNIPFPEKVADNGNNETLLLWMYSRYSIQNEKFINLLKLNHIEYTITEIDEGGLVTEYVYGERIYPVYTITEFELSEFPNINDEYILRSAITNIKGGE